MQKLVRKGKVSEVNYQTGQIRVLFENKQQSNFLYMLDFEYRMPRINDLVAVVMFDEYFGICLGSFYNQVNEPKASGDLWRKDFGSGDYIEYNEAQRVLKIQAQSVKIVGNVEIDGELKVNGSITADSINGGI